MSQRRVTMILHESLTWELEFAAAGVAVVFGAEVSDGVVSQVRGAEDHVVRPDVFKYRKHINKLMFRKS